MSAVLVLPDEATLRARLADLRLLAAQVDQEIALTAERLARVSIGRRPRGVKPPCGTESGYQWHRYHRDLEWPLPSDDPCGCRAAHNAYTRAVDIAKGRAARVRARRAELREAG